MLDSRDKSINGREHFYIDTTSLAVHYVNTIQVQQLYSMQYYLNLKNKFLSSQFREGLKKVNFPFREGLPKYVSASTCIMSAATNV